MTSVILCSPLVWLKGFPRGQARKIHVLAGGSWLSWGSCLREGLRAVCPPLGEDLSTVVTPKHVDGYSRLVPPPLLGTNKKVGRNGGLQWHQPL